MFLKSPTKYEIILEFQTRFQTKTERELTRRQARSSPKPKIAREKQSFFSIVTPNKTVISFAFYRSAFLLRRVSVFEWKSAGGGVERDCESSVQTSGSGH